MAPIRPADREDLPGITALMLRMFPGWAEIPNIEQFLAASLFDDPWADPELPPLVAEADDGEIVGSIGSYVRRIRFGERDLRGVCINNCAVAPEHRGGATGAFLLRRMMSGPQDLSWSDQASSDLIPLWRAFGGEVDYARICDWMLVLRPFRWLASGARALARRGVSREEVPVGALPMQAAGPRLLPRAHPPADPDVLGTDATSRQIAEALPEITRQVRMRVDYDEPFLEHHFAVIESLRGPVVRRLVHRDGQPIGWYACVGDAPGVTRVLHLCAFDPDGDAVLAELVEYARASDSAILSGRLEPHLVGAVRRRIAVCGVARQPTIHARNQELLAEISMRPPLITQLDSEWSAVRTQVYTPTGTSSAATRR